MSRPRLAYYHSPASFSWMSVLAAARDVCDLIWVIDSRRAESAVQRRLLARSGPVVDIRELDPIEAAEAIAVHKPDGLLDFLDGRLVFLSDVARQLELPFVSPATARALTDKWAQRETLAAAGVPTPGHWRVPRRSDAQADERFWREARFPAILKPIHGEASRDTVLVHSEAELSIELDAVSAVRGDDEELILEEYIPDRRHISERRHGLRAQLSDRRDDLNRCFAGYVSVESITSHGRIEHVAITGRFPPAEPFRESGFFMPSALSTADADAVLDAAGAAVAALGVHIGCCHTEVKLTPDGPRVIEVNGRIGGGVDEMLMDMCGYDLMQQAVRVALGEPLGQSPRPDDASVAYLFYVQSPAEMTEVHAVEGLTELHDLPGVSQVILNRGPGARVDWREGNHGHVFSVRGTAGSHTELAEFARELPVRVQIR